MIVLLSGCSNNPKTVLTTEVTDVPIGTTVPSNNVETNSTPMPNNSDSLTVSTISVKAGNKFTVYSSVKKRWYCLGLGRKYTWSTW